MKGSKALVNMVIIISYSQVLIPAGSLKDTLFALLIVRDFHSMIEEVFKWYALLTIEIVRMFSARVTSSGVYTM